MRRRPRGRPTGPALVLAALLPLLALACSATDAPRPTPTGTPAATAEPTATEARATGTAAPTATPVAAGQPFSPEQAQRGREILDRVAQIRDTPQRGAVAMNLIGRREAIELYRAGFDEADLEAVALQEEVYSLLGLIPDDTDLLDTFLVLLGLSIAAFYDPDVKAFYLLDDLGGIDSAASETTIVHELVHALQDQHHDLNALGEALEADWDATRAFASLLEGDAVQTETAYFGRALRSRPTCFAVPPPRRFLGLPSVVIRELDTWYNDGLCFVEAVLPSVGGRTHGLYADLPATTEQILHPDKYLAGEAALPVTLAPLAESLGAGWRERGRSTLGEFGLQNLLLLGLDDRDSVARAAAGWGGDGWVLYEREDARLIQVVTAWDSAVEAAEFWQALAASLTDRDESDVRIDAAALNLSGSVAGKAWRAALSDANEVIFVVSSEAASADRVAAGLGLP